MNAFGEGAKLKQNVQTLTLNSFTYHQVYKSSSRARSVGLTGPVSDVLFLQAADSSAIPQTEPVLLLRFDV